jgi:hypothetical protein
MNLRTHSVRPERRKLVRLIPARTDISALDDLADADDTQRLFCVAGKIGGVVSSADR